MTRSLDDVLSGAIFIGFAAAFATYASLDLNMGTPHRMGPGMFPAGVAALLALIGVAILLPQLGRRPRAESTGGRFPWRALVLVAVAPCLFAALIRAAGFVPAAFLTVFATCYAAPGARLGPSMLLAAALTVFCWLIFAVLLGLPLRALTWVF